MLVSLAGQQREHCVLWIRLVALGLLEPSPFHPRHVGRLYEPDEIRRGVNNLVENPLQRLLPCFVVAVCLGSREAVYTASAIVFSHRSVLRFKGSGWRRYSESKTRLSTGSKILVDHMCGLRATWQLLAI